MACVKKCGHVNCDLSKRESVHHFNPRPSRASMACAIVSALATARAPAGMRPRTRRTPRARPIRPPNPVSFGAPRAPSTNVNNRRELPALARAAGGDGDEALDETLDVDAVMKEITDTSQLGQRDEAFFVGQMVLVLLVAFPPFHVDLGDDAKFGDPLFGLATIALAAVLLVQGSKNLGNSLTPFPKPRADNKLKTGGAYAVVRHPMYSGLIFGCFGVALLPGDPTRTLFTMALAALLNAKAAREEDYLSEMHGADVYGKYATEVPRLIPRIDGMKAVVQDFADGFEQKE